MKQKQLYPELRKDISRDDLIRVLVTESDIARAYLMRPVDTSFVELKDNIHFFMDLARVTSDRLGTKNTHILTRYGNAMKAYQQIPDDREFVTLVQALGPLANKPWRIAKMTEEWRALHGNVSSRITTARNAYVRCQREVLAVMTQAFMVFTNRAYDFGQVISLLSHLQGFPSTRYPVGGLLNPLLNEHEYHYLTDSPNLPIYQATVELLRDYGPGVRYWKQLSLRQFIRLYVAVRNTVFRNIQRDHVVRQVEDGIARQVFTTECVEIAVSRKLQNLREIQSLIPPISDNAFLKSMQDTEASKLSFDVMHDILHEQGRYFGPLKDLVAMIGDSAAAEITVIRSKT